VQLSQGKEQPVHTPLRGYIPAGQDEMHCPDSCTNAPEQVRQEVLSAQVRQVLMQARQVLLLR
jgi:hypothetical protein